MLQELIFIKYEMVSQIDSICRNIQTDIQIGVREEIINTDMERKENYRDTVIIHKDLRFR